MITSTCLGCGQSDDHPKHVLVVTADHESVAFHMDCHSRMSTPCDVCTEQTANAAGLTGDDLRNHLIGA